jgi:hypothetical protein
MVRLIEIRNVYLGGRVRQCNGGKGGGTNTMVPYESAGLTAVKKSGGLVAVWMRHGMVELGGRRRSHGERKVSGHCCGIWLED